MTRSDLLAEAARIRSEAPACSRCGHPPCPFCPGDWCDTFVEDPEDPDERVPCCDMRCDFGGMGEAWSRQVNDLLREHGLSIWPVSEENLALEER